ncbi:uncharacterized protein PV09_09391 [Verruconis gallopava]|uniref:Uncharacterized protein n=1 Tax=Verruconis gallopava TaxID=253628 RepID=A0A0D1X9L2_9PEZI|nr:uncharacterized protein PV09_09391 [Verruconis gallopava]KIV98865.1 hypothetical protein PV09_09391 [Verruconis gallopava]
MQNFADIPTPELLSIAEDLELEYKNLMTQIAFYSAMQVASLELDNRVQIALEKLKTAVIAFSNVERMVEAATKNAKPSAIFEQEKSRSQLPNKSFDIEQKRYTNESDSCDVAMKSIEPDVERLELQSALCGLIATVRNALNLKPRAHKKIELRGPSIRSRAPSPESG